MPTAAEDAAPEGADETEMPAEAFAVTEVGSTDAPNAESDDLFAAMAELNAGDEAFAEAVAEGTPPTESEAPAAEAAVAEVASAETAGEMAAETSDPAADVPASDSDGASQADGGAAPTAQAINRVGGGTAPEPAEDHAV